LRFLGWLLMTLFLLAAASWWAARPTTLDAYYAPPASLPAQPGALLRHEFFVREVPAGTRGWRILYTTTRSDGAPALASALILASDKVPPGRRPLVAGTRGTTGVVPGCAPSLQDHPFANVPPLQPLRDQG
jgi:hypothetical protein